MYEQLRAGKGRGSGGLTVVYALGDRLEDLEVDERGGAVVPVVLVLVVADNAVRAFERGEGDRRVAGNAGHDRLGVEREDGRVHADLVRVEDRWVGGWLEDRGRELFGVCERVLIRAVMGSQ